MSIKSTVLTPTPHADYTKRFNQNLDSRIEKDNTKRIDTLQSRWKDYYTIKRKAIEDKHYDYELHRKRLENDAVRQYETLDKQHRYYNYRYQFYVGTLFDTYI